MNTVYDIGGRAAEITKIFKLCMIKQILWVDLEKKRHDAVK